MANHFIRKCECGRVLAQCRCPDPNKRVDIISPCQCPPNTRPAFTSGGTNDGPQSEGAESETPDSALGSVLARVAQLETDLAMARQGLQSWAELQKRQDQNWRAHCDRISGVLGARIAELEAQLAGGSRA